MAGDYFTKWIEAYAIPNQEAITIAQKLLDEMFCGISLPEKLHSDQGRQFESEVVGAPEALRFGIKKSYRIYNDKVLLNVHNIKTHILF